MLVLDSIFVRQSHRRQGLATELIKRLLVQLSSDPHNDQLLGLSQPVSNSMLVTTLRLLKSRPDLRDRVVLVDDSDGSRGNLWWSAIKLCKDRQIKWS